MGDCREQGQEGSTHAGSPGLEVDRLQKEEDTIRLLKTAPKNDVNSQLVNHLNRLGLNWLQETHPH